MVRCYCYNLVSEDRKRILEFLQDLVSCNDWYGQYGECVLPRDEILCDTLLSSVSVLMLISPTAL